MNKHVIIGTAGHIDHGKSALVEALTGTNPDRLEEEKRRGITIDLGFAFLEWGGLRLGFVDVPGHERFVRNMLAGAGGVDLVLLVIAADESIKPQTREHFDICRLLGVRHGIVAITKSDLVEPDVLALVRLEAEEFVRGSFLEGAPIVSVSARTRDGLEDLKREILGVASRLTGRDAARYARLPIDRAFVMQGFGTVVTGTLVSGTIRAEQELELLPRGTRLRVRGLHSGGHAVEQAEAGQRTAVNLADVGLDEIERGMTLASPGVFLPTERLDVTLSLLASARPLKNHARVHFHQGTAETIAEVHRREHTPLAPGTTGLAQLRLAAPVLALRGDRFILRQFSPLLTIGGGVVLDPLARKHKQGDARVARFLNTLARDDDDEILAAFVEESPRGLEATGITARTGWMESQVRESARQLAAAGGIRIVSEQPMILLSAERFAAAQQAIAAAVDEFHKKNPLMPGIPKEELRARAASGFRAEAFRAALDALVQRRILGLAGDLVQRAGREIPLSPEESQAKEQIATEFERAGLAVPSVAEVLGRLRIDARRAQKLLQILLREKILVKVTEDLMFHRSATARLRDLLAGYKKEHGHRLPIAAFKNLAGVSRKYAIPLLEYTDRERLTRRMGDERVIL